MARNNKDDPTKWPIWRNPNPYPVEVVYMHPGRYALADLMQFASDVLNNGKVINKVTGKYELPPGKRWDPINRKYEDLLPAPSDQPQVTPAVGNLSLHEKAYPDARLIDVAIENDPRFARTWRMNRTDMHDQSPSAYDMALACWGVSAGWTDQQIADLIVGFHAKHGLPTEKVTSPKPRVRGLSYVAATIERARTGHVNSIPEKKLVDEHVRDVEFIGCESKNDLLKALRLSLGIPIERVTKCGLKNSRYSLTVGGVEIYVGVARTLLSFAHVQAVVMDGADAVLRPMKQATWHNQVRKLIEIAERVEVWEAESPFERWVYDYLQANPPAREEEWKDAFSCGGPFNRKGEVWLRSQSLSNWLWAGCHERLDPGQIYSGLRSLGFSSVPVCAWIGGRTVGAQYWHGNIKATMEYFERNLPDSSEEKKSGACKIRVNKNNHEFKNVEKEHPNSGCT